MDKDNIPDLREFKAQCMKKKLTTVGLLTI